MAAIPSYELGLDGARREKGKTTFAFSSNELGAHLFFPSSEVSSMPTMTLSYEANGTGPYPTLTTTTRLNEEYVSFGAGLTKDIGPFTLKMATERLVQRQATVYKKRDLGWQHSLSVAAAVFDNAKVEASLLKKSTDSNDKSVTDVKLQAMLDTHYGSLTPEYTHIQRGDGKTGKKVRVALKTNPLLSSIGVALHASHTFKTWSADKAPAFTANEVGLTIPVAAGCLSVGAIHANNEQKELLQNSALVAFPCGESAVGLKLAFSADLS